MGTAPPKLFQDFQLEQKMSDQQKGGGKKKKKLLVGRREKEGAPPLRPPRSRSLRGSVFSWVSPRQGP